MAAALPSMHRVAWLAWLALLVGSAGVLGCSGNDDETGGNSGGGTGNLDGQARIYVDAHNAVRAAVQKPSSYAGAWQAVPPVAWSETVAKSAQGWANHLRDDLDCGLMHAQGTGYGENLAAGTNVDAERAVAMWAGEKANYTYSPSYVFESDTGHYTQIVWRETTAIGCASAQCGSSNVVVCRYDPPGNYLGQKPY